MMMTGKMMKKPRPMEKNKERTTSFMTKNPFFRKLGTIHGLSLSSVLRKKRPKSKCLQKNNLAVSNLDKAALKFRDILPADTFETEQTVTPSSRSDIKLDLELDSQASISPLSLVCAQELFNSPFSYDGNDDTLKESLDVAEVPNNDDNKEQERHNTYNCLSSLSVTPRTLETILEEEENNGSPGFRVSFAPANDLFLRTLAMERAKALSMSEIAIEASRRNEVALKNTTSLTISRSIKANDMTILQELTKYKLSFNDLLSLLVIILLLFNLLGTSDHIVAGAQASSRRCWMTGLGSLRLGAIDNKYGKEKKMLYNIRNDPVGVWLQ